MRLLLLTKAWRDASHLRITIGLRPAGGWICSARIRTIKGTINIPCHCRALDFILEVAELQSFPECVSCAALFKSHITLPELMSNFEKLAFWFLGVKFTAPLPANP